MKKELIGWEFDWFALDEENNVGLFSSAGSAQVPSIVEDNYLEHETISKSLNLPHYGSTEVWSDFASFGVFVFDFQLHNGPYIKMSAPQGKLTEELKLKILNIRGLPKFWLSFKKVDRIDIAVETFQQQQIT